MAKDKTVWITVLVDNPVSLPSGLMVKKGGAVEVSEKDVVKQHVGKLYSVSEEAPKADSSKEDAPLPDEVEAPKKKK